MTVGARTIMPDWDARTSGASLYVADIELPGLCVAAILRSPYAHANIRRIDTSAAEQMPGVVAVVTAADFGDARYQHMGGPFIDRAPMARDRARFMGEEVAAVAVEDPAVLEQALASIRVSYRRRRAVHDPMRALGRLAPTVHDRARGRNLAYDVDYTWGTDVDAVPGATSLQQRYRFGRQGQVPMESASTLAHWDPTEQRLHVWTSTQAPYFVRKELIGILGLSPDQVATHEVAVGGGFGGKAKVGEHEVIAAMLSIRCGRPVRLVLNRQEEFAATKPRHVFDVDLRTTLDPDGRIVAHDADVVVDNGAYSHTGPGVMGSAVAIIGSLYPTDNAHVRARLVDTNKPPGGSFRGFGAPQATFALESQVDELAAKVGIDPIDLRLRNLRQAGEITHAGLRIGSCALERCLTEVRQMIDWDRLRSQGGNGRGVGVAIAMHVSGANSYDGANRSKARVDVHEDGRVEVRFGGADAGTGQRGLLTQVVAEELGVPAEHVTPVMMDSDQTPPDMGSWSSRGTVMATGAVRAAARQVADELRRRAAGKFAVAPTDVRLESGEAVVGEQAIELASLVSATDDAGALTATADFTVDSDPVNGRTGVSNVSPAYSFAAHAAEVEVDPATGKVRVVRYAAVHDAGRVVNPTAAESQVVGGIVMGLGAALSEELLYEQGRTVNPNYLHYAMPRASDVPPIEVRFVGEDDPNTPYGVKSVGEIALSPVPAAIANAVAHAVGVRVREVPITPDKLLRQTPNTLVGRVRAYRLWRRPSRWWIASMRWAYPRGLHLGLHLVGGWLANRRRRLVAPIDRIEQPDDLAQFAVAAAAPDAQLIGGGTDLLPARRQGLARSSTLIDVTHIDQLAQIRRRDGQWVIGGSVRLAALADWARREGFDAVAQTIDRIATPQIRQMATVAGNLCQQKRCWFYRNGFDCYKRSGALSPCYAVMGEHRFHHAIIDGHRCQAVGPSDLATIFSALGAELMVTGIEGERTVAVQDMYRGPGEPDLRPGEVVTAVRLPPDVDQWHYSFEKLALWDGDFAMASAATALHVVDGVVVDCRLVLGGVSATPWRCLDSERLLRGACVTDLDLPRIAEAWRHEAHPLERNAWKIDAASGLLARAMHDAMPAGFPHASGAAAP